MLLVVSVLVLVLALVLRIAFRVGSWEFGVWERRQGSGARAAAWVRARAGRERVGMVRARSGATAGWTARISLGLVSRASERTEHNILWPPLHFVFCLPHTCSVV